jgi:hypothetical protein
VCGPGRAARSAETRRARRATPRATSRDRFIINPQTGKPLSIKTLELAFETEIQTAKVELNFQVGRFIMDTILGRRPVNFKPIKNEQERARLAIFFAKTRMGWRETP